MKKLLSITAVAIAAAAPSLALAQFSMPSIPGLGKSGSSAPAADLSGQGDALVRNFTAANKDVLTANEFMADALGLKDEATKAQETAKAMGEGGTKDAVQESNKVVADTGGAIASAMAKKPVLDAAAKVRFGEGLIKLVAGVGKYAGLGKDVQSMSAGLKSASPLQLAKLGSAAYVVSKFPSSASELAKSLQNAIAFAKDNNIPVPSNANDVMGALGGFNG